MTAMKSDQNPLLQTYQEIRSQSALSCYLDIIDSIQMKLHLLSPPGVLNFREAGRKVLIFTSQSSCCNKTIGNISLAVHLSRTTVPICRCLKKPKSRPIYRKIGNEREKRLGLSKAKEISSAC